MKDLCLNPLYKMTFINLLTYLLTGHLLQFSADDAPLTSSNHHVLCTTSARSNR